MDKFFRDITKSDVGSRWFLFAVIVLLVLFSWIGFLDKHATTYVDGALVQSTVAFGVAKLLNGLVSVLQSTQLQVGIGAGMAISIGETLDPVNDLVEQYSSVMKFSIGSLVIQKLLIQITSDLFFKVLLTLSGLGLILAVYYRLLIYIGILSKTFVFLAFLRFGIVLVVFLNGAVDRAFILEQTEQEISVLQNVSEQEQQAEIKAKLAKKEKLDFELDGLHEKEKKLKLQLEKSESDITTHSERIQLLDAQKSDENSEKTVFERITNKDKDVEIIDEQLKVEQENLSNMQRKVEGIQDQLEDVSEQIISNQNEQNGTTDGFINMMSKGLSSISSKVSSMLDGEKISQLKEQLEVAASNMINLMAIFVFKTLLLPLFFLYILMKGVNGIWNIDLKQKIFDSKDELMSRPDKAIE